MPGTMSKADLVKDLQDMLQDAANKFTAPAGADFERHLAIAAHDMGRVRNRTKLGTLALTADEPVYAAPADMIRPKMALWGLSERKTRKPWANNFPSVLPRMDAIEGDSGMQIYLSPAPTSAQIVDLGAEFRFYYFAGHVVSDTSASTSIKPEDRHLLLIRSAAQAMTELAANGLSKPVQLGPGVGSMPKNGTPGAMAEQLMNQFKEMAA